MLQVSDVLQIFLMLKLSLTKSLIYNDSFSSDTALTAQVITE